MNGHPSIATTEWTIRRIGDAVELTIVDDERGAILIRIVAEKAKAVGTALAYFATDD